MSLYRTRQVDLKNKIAELVRKAYDECGVSVGLLKNTYLVRVLPKEQRSGNVIIPDLDGPGKQNKPLYEAVVLAVYESYTVDEWIKNSYKQTESEPDWVCKRYWVEPACKVNDHILFQHWEGIPVPPLDMGIGEYRILKEHMIVAIVTYDREKIEDELHALFGERVLLQVDEVVKSILSKYDVIPKNLSCKTLSGA